MALNQYRIQEQKLQNGKIVYMPQSRDKTLTGWIIGWCDMCVLPRTTLEEALKVVEEKKKGDNFWEGNQVKRVLRNLEV